MPIEINGLPPSQVKNTGEGQTARVGRDEPTRERAENGRPASSDTVSLTDVAGRLKHLEASLADQPVVDSQRVEALRKALAEGQYQIDDQRVAEKLLALESKVYGAK